MQETYSEKIPEKKVVEVEKVFQSAGLRKIPTKSPYELWRMSSLNMNAILYTSGKLVLQGSDIGDLKKAVESEIEEAVDSENSIGEGFTPRIGADEVGKGDYFGPLVVAASYVGVKEAEILKDLGIADSKKLSDQRILEIFSQLPASLKYEVEVISPSEYNARYKELKNVSLFLAKLHAANIEKLLKQVKSEGLECNLVVIDQFSKKENRMLDELGELTRESQFQQFHKGESDLAVATASIIARANFLAEWKKMESEWEFDFPKGATNVVDVAKRFVVKNGVDALSKVAKTSFKTTLEVLKI